MKKYLFTIIMICSGLPFTRSFAQTNTFPSSGNAGIGTTSPSYLLSLGTTAKGFSEYNSGGAMDAVKIVANNGGANLGTQNLNANGFSGLEYIDYNGSLACFSGYNNGNQGEFRFNNIASGGYYTFKIAGVDRFYVANSGNIGISTSSPTEKFQIGSKFTFHDGGYKKISYNAWWDANNSQLKRIEAGPVAEFAFTNNGEIILATGPTGNANTTVDNYVNALIVKNDGKIGIGTLTPQAKLAVNGDIYSKKVKVTQSGWPDYVFHTSYRLRPLSEVEQYIKLYHHLPEVPSAAEVEKDGIDLGDSQATLLKKIEELTLYIISLNKEMESLKKDLKKIKADQN
jgi:hypothetical protein